MSELYTTESVPLDEIPLCKCGRFYRVETAAGRWLCGVCDLEECRAVHGRTVKWLEKRKAILQRLKQWVNDE